MCDNTVNSYAYTSVLATDCYETKQLCDKSVNNYSSAIIFFPDWLKSQEMCDETVDACHFLFNSVLDQYITEGL